MSKIETHLEIERKFLVLEADLSEAENIRLNTVETVYLDVGAMSKIDPQLGTGFTDREIRVSKRTNQAGKTKYKTTTKTGGAQLVREEAEAEITEEDFNKAVESFGRAKLNKKRFKFDYLRREFCLDILDTGGKGMAILEVELKNENEYVALPPFVLIKKEVTGDPEYYNVNIAKPLERGTIKKELV